MMGSEKKLVFLVLLTLYVKMSARGCQLKLKKKDEITRDIPEITRV